MVAGAVVVVEVGLDRSSCLTDAQCPDDAEVANGRKVGYR